MKDHERLLYLYINEPCVVIGRNQNPYKEANLRRARDLRIPIIRRRSGGGTVVHDTGNVNFCVQNPRSEFHRTRHLDLIVEYLQKKGANLSVNDRHDIVNSRSQKVSGSSYKIEREKSYHHATMLLNSNLDVIRSLLQRPDRAGQVVGLGTNSVPSPVSNALISADVYIQAWIEVFQAEYGALDPEYFDVDDLDADIRNEVKTLQSWEWNFGETPQFTHTVQGHTFKVQKGEIIQGPGKGSPYRRPFIPREVADYVDPE